MLTERLVVQKDYQPFLVLWGDFFTAPHFTMLNRGSVKELHLRYDESLHWIGRVAHQCRCGEDEWNKDTGKECAVANVRREAIAYASGCKKDDVLPQIYGISAAVPGGEHSFVGDFYVAEYE